MQNPPVSFLQRLVDWQKSRAINTATPKHDHQFVSIPVADTTSVRSFFATSSSKKLWFLAAWEFWGEVVYSGSFCKKPKIPHWLRLRDCCFQQSAVCDREKNWDVLKATKKILETSQRSYHTLNPYIHACTCDGIYTGRVKHEQTMPRIKARKADRPCTNSLEIRSLSFFHFFTGICSRHEERYQATSSSEL